METNLKKALSIFGVVCFSITSLFAGSYDQDGNDTEKHHHKAAVPPGTHPGEDGPCCFFTADYTYWVPRQAGLAYVVSNDYTAGGVAEANKIRGQVFYPNFTGRSGFKVGAGAFLNHDGWDLFVQYTWFYNKQQKDKYQGNANFSPDQGFATWWVDDGGTFAADDIFQAKTSWANFFNRVDAQLARSFYAGHYLQLRPFAGLLGAWDEQWFNIGYKLNAADAGFDTWTNNQKWWGIGPYAGFSSAFLFPIGDNSTQWSLFMDMGTSLPWSKYSVDKKLQEGTAGALTTDAFTRNTYWTTDVMMEMALGLRWETWWTEGMNWNFMVQVAWEEQVWFDHGYMHPIGLEGVAGNGNYIMQGLTAKIKVGF